MTCLCIRNVATVWIFDVISGKFNVERIKGQYLNYGVFHKNKSTAVATDRYVNVEIYAIRKYILISAQDGAVNIM